MSYNIYNTQGIVLNSFDVGEANKFFRIFTRELGLVEATAQGVRKIESKNRYGLQDFSISEISFVRGKDIWRITNVAPQENLFLFFNSGAQPPSRKFGFIANIFSLLKQLLQGEERNEELFDLVIDAIKFLKENDFESGDLENFELLVKMRILYNLGHFDKNGFSEFLENNNFDKKIIEKIGLMKNKVEKEIGEAMEETQL